LPLLVAISRIIFLVLPDSGIPVITFTLVTKTIP
jgi:hypothetical protein